MVGSSLIHWKCSPGLHWNVGQGLFLVQRNSGAGCHTAKRRSREKALLGSHFCRMGVWCLTARFLLMGNQPTHIQSYGTKCLLPIRPGTRAHAFSNSGYIFNQADAHDAIERMKHTRSLVSVGKLPFVIFTNTGQGQESQSKKNKINQQNNWEARIDVARCSIGLVLFVIPCLSSKIALEQL